MNTPSPRDRASHTLIKIEQAVCKQIVELRKSHALNKSQKTNF